MKTRTVITEIAAAGVILTSYPLDLVARTSSMYRCKPRSEPVILTHGFGGSSSNLFALSAYLRLAGFDNISYFEYPRRQLITDSIARLAKIVARKRGGVHLIGHSLGGVIARRFATGAPRGVVRSLITLGSPYLYDQSSPAEIGIFGDDDPLVQAPSMSSVSRGAFARIEILRNVGHLALIFHPEALRIIGTELRSNRAGENRAAA